MRHAKPNGPPKPPHAQSQRDIDIDAASLGRAPADATGADSIKEDDADTDEMEVMHSPEAAALVQLNTELQEQRDKYLRLAAEFDNFRKRSVRERQEAEHRGMGTLIRGILDALDDIGRFAHVDPAVTDSVTLQQGVDMVEKKLLKSLSGHGLEIVSPLGQPFDPAVHEALTTVPAASPDDDHLVAQVYQVGYVFNGLLLRAARVVVQQWKDDSAAPGVAGA